MAIESLSNSLKVCLSTDSRGWTLAMNILDSRLSFPLYHAVKGEKKKKVSTVPDSIVRYTLPDPCVSETAELRRKYSLNLSFAEAKLLRHLGSVTAM